MEADKREFWDAALLISSFQSAEDAFQWFGESNTYDIRTRMRQLNNGDFQVASSSPLAPPASPVEADNELSTEAHPVCAIPQIIVPYGTRKLLVFDTETVGLSPPIVCQLAYMVIADCHVAEEYDEILKLPQGARISMSAQQVHGISNEDCRTKGVDACDALGKFAACACRILECGGRVVAHNSSFDVRAINATRAAWKIETSPLNPELGKDDVFCTMRESKVHSPLVDKAGRKKAFRNDELYTHLFDAPPTFARLHSAKDDVLVTVLNYLEGSRRGWWW
jgi:DNA polymerase III epsilon subunit-like protein